MVRVLGACWGVEGADQRQVDALGRDVAQRQGRDELVVPDRERDWQALHRLRLLPR
jgi:hypothetical protein